MSGESIVYVSEAQPLAHPSEEVIDMVENPVTSDTQVNYVHAKPVSPHMTKYYSNCDTGLSQA